MPKTLLLPCLTGIAAAVLACGVAQAAPPDRRDDAALSVVVRYADLDITREAGARILRTRLAAAAGRVCGGVPDVRRLAETARFRRCRQAAFARAMTDATASTALARSEVASAGPTRR